MTSAPAAIPEELDQQPVAVVTGADRGIGYEVARQLMRRGFEVVLGSRDLAKGEHAARTLGGAGGRVHAVQLDVGDESSVSAMGAWVRDQLGRADVLVNNAAIHYDSWQQAQFADLGIVREALETNLLGAWRTAQELLPLLRNSPRGRIVNVSSEGGSISEMSGGPPAYSVSKASLNALTRLLAGELRSEGILVTQSAPDGRRPTWEKEDVPYPRERQALCGPSSSPTMDRPGDSSGMDGLFRGEPSPDRKESHHEHSRSERTRRCGGGDVLRHRSSSVGRGAGLVRRHRSARLHLTQRR